jgi:hypothetical protein
MLAILPLLAFLGLFWLVRKRGHGWRYAFLVSAMLWTLYLIALTELLSLQSLISRPALAFGWLLLIACLLMFRGIRSRSEIVGGSCSAFPKAPVESSDYRPIALALCVMIALVGITAIISPPNGWDEGSPNSKHQQLGPALHQLGNDAPPGKWWTQRNALIASVTCS